MSRSKMLLPMLAMSALLACRSYQPYSLMEEAGSRSITISSYDPSLPGYHLAGDIGRLEIRPGPDSGINELVLSIRTATDGPSHLEQFLIAAADTAVVSVPNREHEYIQTNTLSAESSRSSALVPAGTWFRFEEVGNTIQVRLLAPTIHLLRNGGRIEWVDWYRR